MKILIIRSAPIYVLNIAIKRIKEDFKRVEIFVLTNREGEYEIRRLKEKVKIIVYPENKFSIFGLGRRLWGRLVKERFDLGVILYSNYFGEGYLNCELILFFILTRSKIAINSSGHKIDITYRKLFQKAFSFFKWIWFLIFWLRVAIVMILRKNIQIRTRRYQ